MSEYFLRTRLHAIVQLMIEYQASIFYVPQELAAAIERKKSCIQNGQELYLSLFFNTLDSNGSIKNRFLYITIQKYKIEIKSIFN